MKKAGQEWLEEMPITIQKAWERNVKKRGFSDERNEIRKQFLLEDISDLHSFIYGSFVFYDTPEGHNFWAAVAKGSKVRNIFLLMKMTFSNLIK
jgi:hypothetical protein